MTLLLVIRAPLVTPENRVDQHRYTSIRTRNTVSVVSRQPLPVFHVKPWESQDLSVAALLTSEALLG